MIVVCTGNNAAKRKEFLGGIFKDNPDRDVVYFDTESFDLGSFMNVLSGGDMFSRQYVAVVSGLVYAELFDFNANISAMAASDTVFIILEDKILKAQVSELKPAAKVWKELATAEKTSEKFNIFSITDAFGARDKKSTWVLLQKALRAGVASEEVLNILIWQAKNLALAKNAASAAETGLAPFVFQKSKSYSKNFETGELKDISRKLTAMFHESHLGLDLGPNLELFLLKTL